MNKTEEADVFTTGIRSDNGDNYYGGGRIDV